MGIVAAVTAVVGLGVNVVGTVGASKAQSAAAATQRRQRTIDAARERRKQVRNARLLQGQVTNQAVLSGAQGSSGALGAVGSVTSQLDSNLSFLDTTLANGNSIASDKSKAATFGAVSAIGGSVFNAAGGSKAVAKLFG